MPPFGLIMGTERANAFKHAIVEELKKRGYISVNYELLAEYIIYLITKKNSPDVISRNMEFDRSFTDWLFAEAAKGAPESERSYIYPAPKEPDTFETMRARMMSGDQETGHPMGGHVEVQQVFLAVVLKEVEGVPASIHSLRKTMKKSSGRYPDLVTITQRPSAISHKLSARMVEDILLARTIYGDRSSIEPLKKEALTFARLAMRVFKEIHEVLTDIINQAQKVHSFEDYQSVMSICKIFDIMASSPDYMRHSMPYGLASAVDKLHTLLRSQPHDALARADADLPVWHQVWTVMTQDIPIWHIQEGIWGYFESIMTQWEDSGEKD
ncbi:hypothetical protein FA95DRAFT_1682432 [Auriscalpium vulgare]|uniref:Uncharacterized protein n=1 Tax=Auriscalpium vulgare TaxID=40419 RepID=A0ACB8RFG0_9AGAM|nr:hypothetical protein FA95DRAFT_1682432 [Auriscalpium vulgare]